ncbi:MULTISPECIES: multicopper oxidase domain-containing protein [unclassified Arthrobacter]|uniref:multicopper oxidase domain-containing protein n=1 Tax=unclassified Arthrobacter TaxID=235627 RepID=UPI001490F8B0|nr:MULTISPECIES: multicopper oxidase domain-containing protein [unclassified Arthrobacter]MBE0008224.1 Tat pathway signal protein [Arthrobacter sp. AET 35A]NOJ61963.1 multicopper oxidase domain-containing protein [Arthrobacter sp. 147(2020)]
MSDHQDNRETGFASGEKSTELAAAPGQLGRWDFLRYGAAAGLGAIALLNSQPAKATQVNRVATAQPFAVSPIPGVLDLYINEGYLRMVDRSLVYHRGFGDRPSNLNDFSPSLAVTPKVFTADGRLVESRSYPLGAPLPPHGTPQPFGPDPANPGQYYIRRNYWASYYPQRTIIAEVGGRIRIRIHNRLSKPHQFVLHGAGPDRSDVGTGSINPGGTALLELDTPAPGTYIYADPTNAPVERVLGLFGVLLVVHPEHQWAIGEDLASFERQWLWICHDVDSVWAGIEASGGTVDPRVTKAVPRFFLLNGRSGFESLGITTDDALNLASEEETLISGYPRQLDVRQFGEGTELGTLRGGQLVRMVNPGIVFHQMHFHGNHLWTVGRNNYNWPRRNGFVDPEGHVVIQQWEDVVELEPMDRKDCIIPIKRPPDAINPVWDARTTDWEYPMHCHAEPSQTAAGGLYPGGLVAHWTLKAPIKGAAL